MSGGSQHWAQASEVRWRLRLHEHPQDAQFCIEFQVKNLSGLVTPFLTIPGKVQISPGKYRSPLPLQGTPPGLGMAPLPTVPSPLSLHPPPSSPQSPGCGPGGGSSGRGRRSPLLTLGAGGGGGGGCWLGREGKGVSQDLGVTGSDKSEVKPMKSQ